MNRFFKKLLFVFTLIIFSQRVFAFPYPAMAPQLPPPVDIPIPNLTQQTQVWCWAAVAQQIIHFKRGPNNTPPQCAMVAASKGVPPNACCYNLNNCAVTGGLHEIQNLLYYYGGSVSSYAPPNNAMALYQTLAQGKPVIMQIKTTPPGTPVGVSHVIIIRGMYFQQTQIGTIPMLIVNDPMNVYTQPVPYHQLAPLWMSSIVVHN